MARRRVSGLLRCGRSGLPEASLLQLELIPKLAGFACVFHSIADTPRRWVALAVGIAENTVFQRHLIGEHLLSGLCRPRLTGDDSFDL